jgi:hypothetical protein
MLEYMFELDGVWRALTVCIAPAWGEREILACFTFCEWVIPAVRPAHPR